VCFTILRKWHSEQRQIALASGEAWKGKTGKHFDDNYIFIQEDGQRMDVDTPSHKFQKLIKLYNLTHEDKLPRIRLHDLRHTSATLLLASGTDIETVSHRLGHSKASITLDVYGHALKSMDKTASDTLETMFRKTAEG